MKLVKIDENLYLNPEFVNSIEPSDDSSSIITMNNNDVFHVNIPIKKVLDAIAVARSTRLNTKIMKTIDEIRINTKSICGCKQI